MNYLAHIYLARHSDAAMLGALLGDFVKGEVAGRYGHEVELEILLHRKVDSYTDNHPVFRQARMLFGESRRRYAGIVLDVFYDHALASRWEAYSEEPLQFFTRRFYAALLTSRPLLPDSLAELAPRMARQDWLASYRELAGMELAIERMSQRLSRNGHLLRDCLLDVRTNYAELDAGFSDFFPDLIAFAQAQRRLLDSAIAKP